MVQKKKTWIYKYEIKLKIFSKQKGSFLYMYLIIQSRDFYLGWPPLGGVHHSRFDGHLQDASLVRLLVQAPHCLVSLLFVRKRHESVALCACDKNGRMFLWVLQKSINVFVICTIACQTNVQRTAAGPNLRFKRKTREFFFRKLPT